MRRLAVAFEDQESGVSLVEILVAMSIFAVAILALVSAMSASMISLSSSRGRQQATTMASRAMEAARNLPYEGVAVRPIDIPDTTFDPDGTGALPVEPVVHDAAGQLTGSPYQTSSGGLTVRTYVTWFTETAATDPLKRVTVVVSWSRRGAAAETVRQSSLIADLDRGLAEAAFDVTPPELGADLATGTTATKCFNQVLTNLGQPDTYDVILPTVGSYPTMASYTVTAYGDANEDGVGSPSEVLPDSDADGTRDIDTPIEPNGTLPIIVCYAPTTPTNVELVASVTIRSVSATATTRVVNHKIYILDFSVNPGSYTVSVMPGVPRCFSHTLTNLLSPDTFAVTLPTAATVPALADYTVAAYRDDNGNDVGDPAETLVDTDADGAVEIVPELAKNQSVKLLVCYTPTNTDNAPFSANVPVTSRATTGQTRTLTHTLKIPKIFYLHDDGPDADHNRTTACTSGYWPMNAIAPTRTTLWDWDRDKDPSDVPGLYLDKGKTNCLGRWQHTLTKPLNVGGTHQLVLWTSWRDAVLQGKTDTKNLMYYATLSAVVSGQPTGGLTGSVSYTHNSAGWVEKTITFPASSTVQMASGDSVILELWCGDPPGGDDHDCQTGYDTVGMQSRLLLERP